MELSVRNAIVSGFVSYCGFVARRTANKAPPGSLSAEDLAQEAIIGVIRAVDRLKPESGELTPQNINYLKKCINTAMADYIRKHDRVHHAVRKQITRIDRISHSGTRPTLGVISENTGLDAKYCRVLQEYGRIREEPLTDFNTPLDLQDPSTLLEAKDTEVNIWEAVSCLTERQIKVLHNLFVNDANVSSVADTLGVSPARVCQIRQDAFNKLQNNPKIRGLYECSAAG